MKICLVRNDKMGDMILTLPVVQGLKQANQDCKIDIVCSVSYTHLTLPTTLTV